MQQFNSRRALEYEGGRSIPTYIPHTLYFLTFSYSDNDVY